jgi:hypothetical protein
VGKRANKSIDLDVESKMKATATDKADGRKEKAEGDLRKIFAAS